MTEEVILNGRTRVASGTILKKGGYRSPPSSNPISTALLHSRRCLTSTPGPHPRFQASLCETSKVLEPVQVELKPFLLARRCPHLKSSSPKGTFLMPVSKSWPEYWTLYLNLNKWKWNNISLKMSQPLVQN